MSKAHTHLDLPNLERPHLERLEAEAIHVMREVAANFAKPVMLYSIGKDSSVMLHLAMKAFYPARPPFPLLHIDTRWKFREMIAFRDRIAAELGFDLLVHINPDGIAENVGPFTHGSSHHTHVMKTLALRQALDKYGFDAAFGGARRDEEKSRAKERIFSFRTQEHAWDPKAQRPEMWKTYNTRIHKGESIRVFPLSNWTELDIWQYILKENIPIVPLYLAAKRPVVERDGMLIMVDDDRMPLGPEDKVEERSVRFRTLGCYPLTGAVPSQADTLEKVVAEMLAATTSERQGRAIDRDEAGSMEKKKREGYFLMPKQSPEADLAAYLRAQEDKSMLRFLTCGSVDDGKSTLIGRLLYDTKLIFEDQLATLASDSRKHGTNGEALDFALLMDGLEAEREQGITIDVAYRFFATDKRKFIVADTPGHEEYTRNMATGASTADLAVVLVDARRGVLTQTRRHSYIASLLGIRHVVLAVNKLDLVDFDQATFDAIVEEYRAFAAELGFETIVAIPLSARFGDNVIARSQNTPWYEGPSLLNHLETVEIAGSGHDQPFRFPIQSVVRPNQDFRGFAGQVAGGRIAVGGPVVAAKSGKTSRIARIVTQGGDLPEAVEGQAVTIVLADEIELSRGNMLVAPTDRPHVADQLQAHLVWFDAKPLIPGRSYILRTETDTVNCTVTALKHEVNVNTLARDAARSLAMNGVGVCNLSLQSPIAFDAYRDNRATGNFILIDRYTNATLGAGMIDFPLRRAENVHWQAMEVDKQARAEIKGQRPAVLWFTGLSGSGKSTIANSLEKLLHAEGRHTYMLDGDNVRHGLNRDLGFTEADRVENIRRVAEVAKLMADAGLIVLVSFISPFKAERRLARDMMEPGEFIEIFVDTPIDECARRDPKGLYKKAREGKIANFTGISSPYEPPENPELRLDTLAEEPDDLARRIADFMGERLVQG